MRDVCVLNPMSYHPYKSMYGLDRWVFSARWQMWHIELPPLIAVSQSRSVVLREGGAVTQGESAGEISSWSPDYAEVPIRTEISSDNMAYKPPNLWREYLQWSLNVAEDQKVDQIVFLIVQ